jgi:hypothetical protein
MDVGMKVLEAFNSLFVVFLFMSLWNVSNNRKWYSSAKVIA